VGFGWDMKVHVYELLYVSSFIADFASSEGEFTVGRKHWSIDVISCALYTEFTSLSVSALCPKEKSPLDGKLAPLM
jgi:hypothetical protein